LQDKISERKRGGKRKKRKKGKDEEKWIVRKNGREK